MSIQTNYEGAPTQQKTRLSPGETHCELTVGSMNLKGFCDPLKQQEFLHIISATSVDVCLVQELKLTPLQVSSFNEFSTEFELVVPLLKPDLIRYDTGFLVRRGVSFELIMPHTSYLLFIKVKSLTKGDNPIVIGNVHGPNATKATWWTEACNEYTTVAETTAIHLLGGDFNLTLVIEDRSPQVELESGHNQLRQLLALHALEDIYDSKYPDMREFTHTQVNHDGTTSLGRIDRMYGTSAITDWTRNWATINTKISDHYLIVCSINSRSTTPKTKASPRLGVGSLQVPAVDSKISEIIATATSWSEVITNISKSIPMLNELGAKKLYSKVKGLLNKRHKIKQGNNCTAEIDEKIATLYHESHYLAAKTEKLLRARLGIAYLTLRPPSGVMKSKGSQAISELAGEDKIVHSTPKEMGVIAHAFYQDLYKKQEPSAIDMEEAIRVLKLEKDPLRLDIIQEEALTKSSAAFTSNELTFAISSLKNGKSPGPDGIPNEFFKQFKGKIQKLLLEEFNAVLNGTRTLGGADMGTIVLLFKKGDAKSLSNYRPITLLNTTYKLFTAMLAKRLSRAVAPLIHKSQHAFLPGRNIFDAIYEAQTFLKEAESMHLAEAALLMLDQAKAYDKTSQTFMYKVLEVLRLPAQTVNCIRNLYRGFQAKINLNGVLSPCVSVEQGVKQGDPLSCILFVCIMETLGSLVRHATKRDDAITLFADDASINVSCLRTDWPKLQAPLKSFCAATMAVFNEGKTEVLLLGNKRADYPADLPEPAVRGQSVRCLGAPIGIDLNYEQIAREKLDKLLVDAKKINLTNLTVRERRHTMQIWVYSKLVFLMGCYAFPKTLLSDFDAAIHALTFKGRTTPWATLEALTLSPLDGGLGGTNARQIMDLAHYRIAGGLVNLHERPQKNWEQRLVSIWIKESLNRSRSTSALHSDALPQGRIEALLVNPFLQDITDVGILKGAWPPLFSAVLQTWRNSEVELDLSVKFNKRALPIAYSIFLPQGSRTPAWQSVNIMYTRSNVVSWGDLADASQPTYTGHLLGTSEQGVLRKVTTFMDLTPVSKATLLAASTEQPEGYMPSWIGLAVKVTIKKVRGNGYNNEKIMPLLPHANRRYALARSQGTPMISPNWGKFWRLRHEEPLMEFLYRLVHNKLRVGTRMPLAVDNQCPSCGGIESRDHLLFHCPTTQPFCQKVRDWSNTQVREGIMSVRTPLLDLITAKVENPVAEKLWHIGFAHYLWYLWKRRNLRKYASEVYPCTEMLVAEWKLATRSRLQDLDQELGWFTPAGQQPNQIHREAD